MQILETRPFSVNDFKITLKNNFNSLLRSVAEANSRTLRNEVNNYLDAKNYEIPIDYIEALYRKVSNIVPHNKINKAKLNSINQIILLISKDNSQKQVPQQHALLNFIKETETTEIVEIGLKIELTKKKIDELNMEKYFMIEHTNDKITKLSNDINDYIQLSLTLNDPNELDKHDKRMMRSVIDVTHVTNSLNIDIAAKNDKYNFRQNH